MHKRWSIAAALVGVLALAGPVSAITNGAPDANEHRYVGELLFYVPDAEDSRFDDPGGWFTCTGTLLKSTLVVTAGHCTFGIGKNGVSTTHDGKDTTAAQGGVGGNDVWINFQEVPDFSILPPSSTFTRSQNPQRYQAWKNALNGNANWHRATATPHPLYDDNAFFVHDVGIVHLQSPGVVLPQSQYGVLPSVDQFDAFKTQRGQQKVTFTSVGYGLQQINPVHVQGARVRMLAHPRLIQINGGIVGDFSMLLSNNHSTGGTCFGDSGGPNYLGDSNIVAGITSFGLNGNCAGTGGVFRTDRQNVLDFINSHLNP